MKKLIIIPFLLISIFAFSQTEDNFSILKFELNANGTVTTDPTNPPKLKLPIKFIFGANFHGKSVKITSNDNTPLAPKVVKFGDENLQKDGEDNTYRIEISRERIINPGDNDKINVDNFVLHIEQNKINLSIFPAGNEGLGAGEPKKEEEYKAGYIYYDVMNLIDKNSGSRLKTLILGSYGVDKNTVESNPFLKEEFGGLYSEGLAEGGFGGLIGDLGNTDVTNIAAGLARFLAERTKEELNEAFFSKMKEQLNAYPELKTVFPQTSKFLSIIETYSYASVIQRWL